MSHSVQKVGVQIVETITVFDNTGAEVTGLVNADFTKALHKDGVVQSAAGVAVTEIGIGEYKVTFTPASAGTWRLRVEQSSGSAYNKRGWEETYDVSVGGVLSTSDVAAAVWAYLVEGAFTAGRMLRIVAAVLAGKTAGGRSSITARDLSDSTNMLVGSADEAGDRTPTSYGS